MSVMHDQYVRNIITHPNNKMPQGGRRMIDRYIIGVHVRGTHAKVSIPLPIRSVVFLFRDDNCQSSD